MRLSMAGWAWAGCLVLGAALLGGCGGGEMTPIHSEAEFDQMVVKSNKVVLVDFYKGWCPTCAVLDGVMDKLAREYKGRVVVAKFKLVQPYFAVTSQKLKDRYDIHFYPTAILFVNGVDVTHFVMDYDTAEYRKALDAELGGPATRKPTPTTRPAR